MSTTPPSAIASQIITQAIAVLQSIAQLQNKVVFVYDDDDLADKLKGVKTYPAVGIIYEGMRAVMTPGESYKATTGKLGMSAELVISFVIAQQPETIVATDAKTPVIILLDAIRSSMMGTRSATGHLWRFVVEAPAVKSKGLAFWVQRWSVPVQLPPSQC